MDTTAVLYWVINKTCSPARWVHVWVYSNLYLSLYFRVSVCLSIQSNLDSHCILLAFNVVSRLVRVVVASVARQEGGAGRGREWVVRRWHYWTFETDVPPCNKYLTLGLSNTDFVLVLHMNSFEGRATGLHTLYILVWVGVYPVASRVIKTKVASLISLGIC